MNDTSVLKTDVTKLKFHWIDIGTKKRLVLI